MEMLKPMKMIMQNLTDEMCNTSVKFAPGSPCLLQTAQAYLKYY
jgi:hypothetical protein